MATTFRSEIKPVKQESVPEPKTPDVVIEDGGDVPIALHQEIKGKPYSKVFFDITTEMPDSLENDLTIIDSAYRKRVESGQYQDGEDTFKEMIKEAEKVTDTKNSNYNIKIAKIAEYLKFIDRLKDIDKQKERWS